MTRGCCASSCSARRHCRAFSQAESAAFQAAGPCARRSSARALRHCHCFSQALTAAPSEASSSRGSSKACCHLAAKRLRRHRTPSKAIEKHLKTIENH